MGIMDVSRLMDKIFRDIPFVFVYLDDILIESASHDQHVEHLCKVFSLLDKNGLIINRDKCRLGLTELDFLGHIVAKEGITPLPVSEGMQYLLTIIDRFTRWPEAIPIPDATAETCGRALLRHWIALYCVPDDATSDQGPQFVSHIWQNWESCWEQK